MKKAFEKEKEYVRSLIVQKEKPQPPFALHRRWHAAWEQCHTAKLDRWRATAFVAKELLAEIASTSFSYFWDYALTTRVKYCTYCINYCKFLRTFCTRVEEIRESCRITAHRINFQTTRVQHCLGTIAMNMAGKRSGEPYQGITD